jgi:hypothetical protein
MKAAGLAARVATKLPSADGFGVTLWLGQRDDDARVERKAA